MKNTKTTLLHRDLNQRDYNYQDIKSLWSECLEGHRGTFSSTLVLRLVNMNDIGAFSFLTFFLNFQPLGLDRVHVEPTVFSWALVSCRGYHPTLPSHRVEHFLPQVCALGPTRKPSQLRPTWFHPLLGRRRTQRVLPVTRRPWMWQVHIIRFYKVAGVRAKGSRVP